MSWLGLITTRWGYKLALIFETGPIKKTLHPNICMRAMRYFQSIYEFIQNFISLQNIWLQRQCIRNWQKEAAVFLVPKFCKIDDNRGLAIYVKKQIRWIQKENDIFIQIFQDVSGNSDYKYDEWAESSEWFVDDMDWEVFEADQQFIGITFAGRLNFYGLQMFG